MDVFVELVNETSNMTHDVPFSDSNGLSYWINAVKLMRNICVPVIALVGIIGNTLSCLVFSSRSMKKSSCSVFLASLAFVDCLFLLSLVLNWVDGEIRGIITTDIACQCLIFVTHVTSFLSVWFIVGFTLERCIAICFPLKRIVICSVYREKIVVGILSFLSFILYNFCFWTSGMQQLGSELRCSHKMEYFRFLNIITWMDTFVTMVIPFTLISTMNCIVLRTVLVCPLRNRIISNGKRIGKVCCSKISQNMKSLDPLLNPNDAIQTQSVTRSKIINPKVRVTRTLLFVSMTFLVLNLPSHVVRLYNLIYSVVIDNAFISEEYFFLQEVTLMFYYMTFSCNFFLYTLFGRNFKKSLIMKLKCISSKQIREQQMRRLMRSNQAGCVNTRVTSL